MHKFRKTLARFTVVFFFFAASKHLDIFLQIIFVILYSNYCNQSQIIRKNYAIKYNT